MTPQIRPRLTLLCGPAGSGKTDHALHRFQERPDSTLLVVPSPPQAETCLHSLAVRLNCPEANLRDRVFTFPALTMSILNTARPDGFSLIGGLMQRLILTDIVQTTVRTDDFFARMRNTLGFVPALTDRLREWKLARLTPDTLESAGQQAAQQLDDPASVRKITELSRLFRAYERFLNENRFRDSEDCLRLAARHLHHRTARIPNNANLLIVDGFYRFNPAQRALLSAIASTGETASYSNDAGNAPIIPFPSTNFESSDDFDDYLLESEESGLPVPVEVVVSLPCEPNRSLLFAAPERTRQTFLAEFDVEEIRLSATPGSRPATMTQLERNLFTPAAEIAPSLENTPASGHVSCQIFDSPNPYVEAEMVAREFRRQYDQGGVKWSDFAVILRAFGDYAPILSAVFERYQIPLGVDGPEKLAENPLIRTVLDLLAVVRFGWQRENVLAFLKSSYTAPDKLAADHLRRQARRAGVRQGRERWLELAAGRAPEDTVALTLHAMAQFDHEVSKGPMLAMDYAEALKQAVETFGIVERVAAGEPVRQGRDLAAWKEALDTLFGIAHMAQLREHQILSFPHFYAELLTAWQSMAPIVPMEGDVVRVAEPYDARERPLKIAAVMGLTERVFPRRISEDPFLRDDERKALRQAAGIDLEEMKNRADDERLFFYLAVTAPSQHLILSYPRSANESDTLPSFYLDEVAAVFTGSPNECPSPVTVSRTLADVAPRSGDAVSPDDHLLAACADIFDPGSDAEEKARHERSQQAVINLQSLLADTSRRSSLQEVLASRHLPEWPRLLQPAHQALLTATNRVYSVTELETYRRCPFQYLLRHILHLQPEEDGFESRLQGELLHKVLRRSFRRRKELKKPMDAEPLRQELQTLLAEELETATTDASPHRLAIARRELSDALDGFVKRETLFTPLFGMRPAYFELAFGMGEAAVLHDEEREASETAEYDPLSCQEPLRLSLNEGESIGVCGAIDRVDLDHQGRAMAMDYKLGPSPNFNDIMQGNSLQMPLYLLALEQLFGMTPAAGCYDSMEETGRPRFHRLNLVGVKEFSPVAPLESGTSVKPLNREQYAVLTRTATAAAIETARGIRSANIAPTPGDHCRTCPYSDVCRTTLLGGHDGEEKPLF